MKNNGVMLLGIFLILIGALAFMHNYELINLSWGMVWPLFILFPGLIFEAGYFLGNRKDVGLLVPGGVLMTYGSLFMFCVLYGFQWMGLLWPFFLLGPAFGLLQVYLFGSRERGILVPVGILTAIATIFLTMNLTTLDVGGIVFPTILMVIGFIIIMGSVNKSRKAPIDNN